MKAKKSGTPKAPLRTSSGKSSAGKSSGRPSSSRKRTPRQSSSRKQSRKESTGGTATNWRQTGVVHWWLSGDETCAFCHGLYVYETEYRCCDCDRPMCPGCVAVREVGECACPECCENH